MATSGATANDLAEMLIGDGTPFSGATYTGDPRAVGTFDGFDSIGMPKGVVLSTGLVSGTAGTDANNLDTGSAVPGPNRWGKTGFVFSTAGDAYLDQLLRDNVANPRPTHDAAVLEFDFVPGSDQVTFKFVFGSEEYQEFVGSPFNDVFALTVNGRNCAVVDGSGELISVNTVNQTKNSGQYRDNPAVASGSSAYDTGFDGITTVLTCRADVNMGVTNHVKFAIADTNDTIYDSGVFIGGGSFRTRYSDIKGTIANDLNGDGAISPSEPGIPGQTVALYDHAYKLLETQVTDSSGRYVFSVPDGETYYVRPVAIKATLPDGRVVNAVQTFGAGSAANPVTVKCRGGDITTAAGGKCDGAKAPNTADPAPGAVGSTGDPAQWLTYASVTITNHAETSPGFGFSASGSYGDSPLGTLTPGTQMPAHVNGADPVVWLGAELGNYPAPAYDGVAHNATDDGVYIDSFAGKLPLEGTVLASTKTYQLAGDVSGPDAAAAHVKGWVADGGSGALWNPTPKWTPTVAAGKATGPFQYATSPVTGVIPTIQMRAQVSTADIKLPTNADGEYYSDTVQATPGEIEDYSFRVADAVYRPAAVTSAGSGTFTVAGATITAGTTIKVGPAVGVTAGAVQNLTASIPTGWRVESVTVKDTESGTTVATPAFTVAGGSASFSYTPALASDVIIVVQYGPTVDLSKSTFTVSPVATSERSTWVVANGRDAYTGTLTARDASDNPITDLTLSEISFTASSSHVVVSAVTRGATPGTYTVTFKSTWAEAGVTAQVAYAGSPIVDAGGVTVTRPIPFKNGPPVPNCTDPTREGSNLTAVPASLKINETSNLTALITDEFCNPVPDEPVAFSLDPGSNGVLTVTAGTTNADGKAFATLTDATAETVKAHAKIQYLGSPTDIHNSPVSVTFAPDGFSPEKSTFTVAPVAVVGDKTTYVVANGRDAYTGTLTARDDGGNLLPGLDLTKVSFTASSTHVIVGTPAAGPTPGTYVVTFKSKWAEATPTAQVAFDGHAVTSGGVTVTRPIPFKAGPPVPNPDCTDPARPGTNLSANPMSLPIGGTSNITAFITDEFCNPVEGAKVDFSLGAGTNGVLNIINDTTDAAGNAFATLTDDKGERVPVHAKIQYLGSPTDIHNSPVTVTFTDNVAPAAPVITWPTNGTLTNLKPLPIRGTGEPGATLVVTTSGGSTVCTVDSVPASGEWTCSTSTLADGTYTITARQTDPSGNVSPQSAPVTFTYDTTPPAPPVITTANAEKIAGTAEPESRITVKYPKKDGTTGTVTGDTDRGGNWSIPTPADATDGPIFVNATDKAGNTSTPDTEGYLDVTPPAPPIVDPTNGSEITGYSEPGSTVVITDTSGRPIPGCESVRADDKGNFMCTPTTRIPTGTVVKVVAIDQAGNKSQPTLVTVSEIKLEVMFKTRERGQAQTVIGTNFNRGERVCVALDSSPVENPCDNADDHGTVKITFIVPRDAALGDHIVTATGEKSGRASATFTVITTVVTTGGTAVPPEGIPLGLLAGAMLVGAGVFTAGTRLLKTRS